MVWFGVGFVARDYLECILGMWSIPFVGTFTPQTTEALEFREALISAPQKGFSSIIVEGDSAQIVQALAQDGIVFSD
ncbi:hypothetical protein RHMOL_Rhmol01G0152300 [Rhododendron molle]|uniref:Uncharacterized protein n=1 Tax=Rhododendron molle TaxID=49168 RepID=A0ACC0Q2A5_RHOML|nr:hypothetical protein RHMOL_Rhmol01G0152300 [Rhododendron molle]